MTAEYARPPVGLVSERMRLIVGIILVVVCVFGGYAAMGGHLEVLVQPWEGVIILGAAIQKWISVLNGGPIPATAEQG